MKSLTKSLYAFGIIALISTQTVSAFQPKETARYFNGPTVSSVTDTSAIVSLSPEVLAGIADEEKQGVYFEYSETYQMCIAIYPTPVACLPKKTEVGKTSSTLTNLKPNTSYTVKYKRDNTIRCITTPCPGNEFESLSVEFKTQPVGTATSTPSPTGITKNLGLGSWGTQVTYLQNTLIQEGYLKVSATGYFGILTRRAVMEFQRARNILATGFVGPLTRDALQNIASPTTATFEGTVTAYSTQCFVDGECSITVDGKKIVTTTGWSQQIVGTVTGIPDFGSIEQKVGSRATVYAKKTADGYTLYGSADYYIHIQ